MSQVRVRFAPSPTGYFHVGGARTALFNWIYARQHNGVFVLRIEDTDRERSTTESISYFIDGLKWLGLDWDEGPFFQGERRELHEGAARELLESKSAYRCFCTQEELAAEKERAIAEKRAWKCPGGCRGRTEADGAARAGDGEAHVVRFRVPEGEAVEFDDLVYGKNSIAAADIEDFVLLRSDGSPLYNLGVVVDDADMGITHVIRGQDHLSNTPKQILLYRALGKEVPIFGHLPLILAPNKAKLSKRKHGEIVSLPYYKERGILPEAFCNFLALLGWAPGAEDEKLGMKELIEKFDISRVNKSNAVFDYREGDARNWTDPKAIAINGRFISEMPVADLLPLVREQLEGAGLWREEFAGEKKEWFQTAIDLVRDRFRTINDFSTLGRPYFSDDFEMEEKPVKKNLGKEGLAGLLPQLADHLAALGRFDAETVEEAVRAFAEEKQVKPGLIINASRTALTGTNVGPSMFPIYELLGQEKTVQRLRAAEAYVKQG